jgi:hypothetical protein
MLGPWDEGRNPTLTGGLQAPRGSPTDTLKLDVNAPAGSSRKVNLHLGDLSRPMADNIPDVLTDMLEIAAYVYCADQFTKRGTELMTNMGTDWRRKFRFRILALSYSPPLVSSSRGCSAKIS